jgi:16S rRNA (cytidine1402-2'-O)-methyltransferase
VLILAATPIGNLSDASSRLIEALADAKFIAAEDTRSLSKLAGLLGVKLQAKLFSLHEHNESDRIDQLLEIAQDNDVLVVSDAGMPTVSDPGFLLVRAAVAKGIEVSIIPGPSAVLSALAVSGLPTDRFTFEGFVARKDGDRKALFEELKTEPRTMVFFESPHRILETLETAANILGADRRASVSRELTKKFEHTERGTLTELADWAKQEPKGEMVLVIAGAVKAKVSPADLVGDVLKLTSGGMRLKDAVAEIAEQNSVSKSVLYQLALDAK